VNTLTNSPYRHGDRAGIRTVSGTDAVIGEDGSSIHIATVPASTSTSARPRFGGVLSL